jgi:hypothetical protein
MALLRCPACRQICGDNPDIEATDEDGTAVDVAVCFTCAELEAGIADDYY